MTHFRNRQLILAALMMTAAHEYGLETMVHAQSGKGKPKVKVSASEIKQIDSRLEKLQQTFQTESTAIIEGYEKAGHYERARFLLEVLLKLDPDNEAIKKRIAEETDQIMSQAEYEQRFDASSDWTPVGNVYKGQSVRISASGEYRVSLPFTNISAAGFPSDDIATHLQASIPTGALMGMVVTEESIRDKKPPQPFAIKMKHDFTPKDNGQLFLKVNLPPGSRCNGELKLKLSGVLHTS